MNKMSKASAARVAPVLQNALVIAATYILLSVMLVVGVTPEQHDIQVGSPAPMDILATKDVNDVVTTEEHREAAAAQVAAPADAPADADSDDASRAAPFDDEEEDAEATPVARVGSTGANDDDDIFIDDTPDEFDDDDDDDDDLDEEELQDDTEDEET